MKARVSRVIRDEIPINQERSLGDLSIKRIEFSHR